MNDYKAQIIDGSLKSPLLALTTARLPEQLRRWRFSAAGGGASLAATFRDRGLERGPTASRGVLANVGETSAAL